MSIAKSAEQVKSVMFPREESQRKLELTDKEMVYAGVPIDLFRFFDKDTGKVGETELKRLGEINSMLEGSVGDKMAMLSKYERELGVRHFSESRINRLWNYLKMGSQINELTKKRDALKGNIYV